MDDDILGAPHGLKGLADQFGPGLDEDLEGHVIGHEVVLDQRADNVVLRFRGGGEADFDFLEADVQQSLEETEFFFLLHGRDQGLIAVPQVDAAPDGSLFDDLVGPLPVLQRNLPKGNILFDRLLHFCSLLTVADRGPPNLPAPAGKRKLPAPFLSKRGEETNSTLYHPHSAGHTGPLSLQQGLYL